MSDAPSSTPSQTIRVRPASSSSLIPLAGAALAAGATTASAQFVNFSINQTIASADGSQSLYANLSTGASSFTNEAGTDAEFSWNVNGFTASYTVGRNPTFATDNATYSKPDGNGGSTTGFDSYLYAYQAGDSIGPSTNFAGGSVSSATKAFDTTNTSAWSTGPGIHYLGFNFNADGSQQDYGWIKVSSTYDADLGSMDYSFLDGAYRSDGQAINAGQASAVPEPTSTGLALGVFALVAGSAAMLRRRRELLAPAQA